MDAHGVHIFNGTDNNDIVIFIPHDFEFIFFPAQNRFFKHDLSDKTGVESCFCQFFQIFRVVCSTTTCAAQGETGADNDWKSDIVGNGPDLFQVGCKTAFGNAESDIFHGVSKKFPVLSFINRCDGCTDHFNPKFIEYPHLGNFNGGIKTGLASESWKQRTRPFSFDDFCNHQWNHRFNVGSVGHFRIGHDGCRIAVDQYDLVAFFF